MPNRNYQRGVRFENDVRRIFESFGYTAFRSAGSKGTIDLAAFGQAESFVIQCKATTGEITTTYLKSLRKEKNLKLLARLKLAPFMNKILAVKGINGTFFYIYRNRRWRIFQLTERK